MTLETTAPDSPPERRGIFTQELLDRCISCGFCLPACPTYGLTRVETSSPRGRINLMRAIETGVLDEDDPTVVEESSFCLGCRACEPVCPAGVQYGALLEEWRDRLWRGRRRPLKLRALLWAVDRRRRVRLMGLPRRHAQRRSGGDGDGGGERASLMLGCFERAMYPGVSRAAQRLDPGLAAPAAQGCCGALHAHNGELERGRALARELGEALPGTIVTTSGGCAAHLASVLGPERVKELSQWLAGRDGEAVAAEPAEERGEARAIDGPAGAGERPRPEGGEEGPPREPGEVGGGETRATSRRGGEAASERGGEAASERGGEAASERGGEAASERGGGATSEGGGDGTRAAGGDGRAPGERGGARRARIGLQDSCHLRNGLGVWREPRALIERLGEYVELPSAAACCGAAGTYAILRPDDSARVLDRHLDEIAAANLDAIVVVNPGCYRQLEQGVKRRGLRTRVVHLAELAAESL